MVSRFRILALVAAPVVALVVAIGVHRYAIAPIRESYLIERQTRALAVLGEQIERLVDDAIFSADAPMKRAVELKQTLTKASLDESGRKKIEKEIEEELEHAVDVSVSPSRGPFIRSISCPAGMSAGSIVPSRDALGNAESDVRTFRPAKASRSFEHTTSSVTVAAPYGFCYRVNLGDAIAGLIEGSPLEEDDIFLTDSDGRVFYERRVSGVSFAGFDPRAEPAKCDDGTAGGSEWEPPPLSRAQSATLVTHVRLGHARAPDTLLFTQPVRIRDQIWVVGTLLPDSRISTEARRIPPVYLGLVPVAGILVLLAFPFVKLMTVGNRQAFTVRDGHMLAICGVGATALLTLLAFAWVGHRKVREWTDSEMQTYSGMLRDNFGGELRAAIDVLAEFGSNEAKDRLYLDASPCRLHRVHQKVPARGRYPYFDMMVGIGGDGQQFLKCTLGPNATPKANVQSFALFSDVQSCRLLSLPPSSNGTSPASYALTVQTSPFTGLPIAMVSMPLEHAAPCTARAKSVIVIVPHLLSLVRPVVPPDLGFAVIQDDGKVLFHSTESRRLFENFLVESDGTQALRAAIFARRPDFVGFGYHGRPQRAFVRPLDGTPWSLIVFRDVDVDRALQIEVVGTCFLLFVLYVIAYLFTVGALRLVWPKERGEWLWLDPNAAPAYRRVVLSLLVIVGWFSATVSNMPSMFAATNAITFPILAITVVFLILGRSANPGQRRVAIVVSVVATLTVVAASRTVGFMYGMIAAGMAVLLVAMLLLPDSTFTRETDRSDSTVAPFRTRQAYTAMFVLLLIIVGVLPTATFFVDAFEETMEKNTRRRHLLLAEAIGARAWRIHQAVTDGYDDGWATQRIKDARDLPLALYGVWGWDGAAVSSHAEAPTPKSDGSDLLDDVCSDIEWPGRCTAAAPAGREPHACDLSQELCDTIGTHFTASISALAPVYDPFVQLRETAFTHGSDFTWSSRLVSDSPDTRCMQTAVWDVRRGPADAPNDGGTVVASRVLRFERPQKAVPIVVALGVIGLALYLVWYGVSQVLARVFGTSFATAAARIPAGEEPVRGHLHLQLTHEETEEIVGPLRPWVIDFLQVGAPRTWPRWDRLPPHTSVAVVHFEHRLDEPEWNRAKLELLERLVFRDGTGQVEIVSAIDPLPYFARRLRSPGDEADERSFLAPSELIRWSRVMENVEKKPTEAPRETVIFARPGLEQFLARECGWSGRLRTIEKELRPEIGATLRTRAQIVDRVRYAADAHYRVLWYSSTDEERLVLFHLASGHLVTPATWRTVRRLARRGLVRWRNDARSMRPVVVSESFRRFVLSVESPARIRVWEHAGGITSWERLRTGILLVTMVAGLFLLIVQPDTFGKWSGLLGTFVGAAGTLSQLLGLYRGSTPTPAAER